MITLTGFPVVSFVDSRQQGAPGDDRESTGADPRQDDSAEQVKAPRAPCRLEPANKTRVLLTGSKNTSTGDVWPGTTAPRPDTT